MLGKPFTSSRSSREGGKSSYGEAFGITTSEQPIPVKQMKPEAELEVSAEHAGLLKTYPFTSTRMKMYNKYTSSLSLTCFSCVHSISCKICM